MTTNRTSKTYYLLLSICLTSYSGAVLSCGDSKHSALGNNFIKEKGNNQHANNLYRNGEEYIHGKGRVKNITKGLELITQSASAGDFNAQRLLGNYYLHGKHGLKKNITVGISWLKKAAEQSDPRARYYLFKAYLEDKSLIGNDTDYVKMRDWLIFSASKNYLPAQNTLAYLYAASIATGHGTFDKQNIFHLNLDFAEDEIINLQIQAARNGSVSTLGILLSNIDDICSGYGFAENNIDVLSNKTRMAFIRLLNDTKACPSKTGAQRIDYNNMIRIADLIKKNECPALIVKQ